jgi:ABC-2 type transport system permease protein
MWSIRIALSKLRPFDFSMFVRVVVVLLLVTGFLWADYALFRRLFHAAAGVEAETPLFALGLLRNLLAMVFLVATVILFSSALTAAIGSFFTDLDLDIHHAGPRPKLTIAVTRWGKTLLQSALVVFVFLVPLVITFARQYEKPPLFYASVLVNLAALLTIPVSLASLVILLLVRFFPVRRVHQVSAMLAMLVVSIAVIAFRMSRPERFFAEISTDDVVRVLQTIDLPAMSVYPSTSLAELMTRGSFEGVVLAPRIAVTAVVLFLLFLAAARTWYFTAFVRARESMAPVAVGSASTTRIIERLFARADPPLRALVGKEIRTIGRDAAQWSQVFLMAALLFIYLYNIRMLPLGGDARATLVAYANLGMSGFMIAAICLRFAYPSVSVEGKAFWILQSSPVSYRQFMVVKILVYATPLTLLAMVMTALANVILEANATVWAFTLFGAALLALTLSSLGVGLGALSPNFNAENPLQVGLSLGGFAYMAIALAYVGMMMALMARPVMRYFLYRVFGSGESASWLSIAIPLATALLVSAALALIPVLIAERRLTRITETD